MALHHLDVNAVRRELLAVRDTFHAFNLGTSGDIAHAMGVGPLKRLMALLPQDPDLVDNVPETTSRALGAYVSTITDGRCWDLTRDDGEILFVSEWMIDRATELMDKLQDHLPVVEPAAVVVELDEGGGQSSAGTDGLRKALQIYSGGLADDKIKAVADILTGKHGTVEHRLQEIDRVLPIPPSTSASRLGKALGVSGAAVKKTDWWNEKRRGVEEAVIEDRHRRLRRNAEG